jgi:hypothetical protein
VLWSGHFVFGSIYTHASDCLSFVTETDPEEDRIEPSEMASVRFVPLTLLPIGTFCRQRFL